jgi:hypothetical protein
MADVQEISKNDVSLKEDRKIVTDSKQVEIINFTEMQQEKIPQVCKNNKEREKLKKKNIINGKKNS